MPKKKVPKKKAAADADPDPEEAAAEKGPVEPRKKKLSAKERRKLKEDERQVAPNPAGCLCGVASTPLVASLRCCPVPLPRATAALYHYPVLLLLSTTAPCYSSPGC